MKKHFLFAAALFAALSFGFVSCENPDDDKFGNSTEQSDDNETPDSGDDIVEVKLTVETNNGNYGTVTGSGLYEVGTKVTITATPKENYHFTGWSDCDSKELTRTVQVNSDTTITSNFAKKPYLTAKSNSSNYGTVTGSGYYDVGAEATITAAPVGATMPSRVEIAIADVSEDEPAPLANVQGQFLQNGEVVCEAVSDENGKLVFPIARSGEGTVNITLPQGYVVAMDGDAFPYVNGQTAPSFTLSVPLNGTASASGNAIRSASVSGRLVEDATNTGIVTAESMPLPGFTVQAIDTDGQVALETVTYENGAYTLSPLLPETYYVRFLLDDRYIATPCLSDESSEHNAIYIQEPLFGETDAVVLYPGQQKVSVNGALFRAGSVEGCVLLNPELNELATNAGGAQGITVTLLDENGQVWQDYAYDISDENGAFCIKGILPGTYSLQYELPAAHAYVSPAAEGIYLIGQSFTIENGSQIQQPPVGVVKTASISGRVMDYTTQNGVDATLSLMPLDGGETVNITSDENGAYAFDGLLPGDYMLTVTLKGGYLFADSHDSILPYLNDNASGMVISLPMGIVEEDWNVIASKPVDWNITLFKDANENGILDADETAASGRTLHLFLRNDMIDSYVSDENGVVHLTGVIPAQYTAKVDLVDGEYFSMNPYENTETINADGLTIALHQQSEISGQVWSLDGTANGIAGIRITLVGDGMELTGTTTDENGCFTFDKLHRGDYQLRAELPEGYLFARIQDGQTRASYILSQTDGSLLFGVIPLQYGQQFTGADIGIGGMGAIGDTAWLDENKNGMQDIGEPCLPGIQIELYQHGMLVASTETDVYGRYAMNGLYPGSYEMKVTMPKEIKPTLQQTEFPLVASILPESSETTVTVEEVIVPSMGRNLNMDLGFVLKKKNVYPDCMKDIPEKDWTPYGRTEED